MEGSAQVDRFAHERLPPPSQWPVLLFTRPELQFPPRMNCARELLERWVESGHGHRPCVVGAEQQWTYADLDAWASRIAHVLVSDMGVRSGERVLLRGGNSPMLAACWFAVQKVGAIAVATMPLLRAGELVKVIDKARIRHALCAANLLDDLRLAQREAPQLQQVRVWGDASSQGLERLAQAHPASFPALDTAADDIALIAFTSGTTGVPKGTVHFHRDVMAICRCWPPQCLQPTANDVFIGSPPLAFTFGLGGLLLFPMTVGASTVLLEKLPPDQLLQAIAAHRATICFTAPTSYRAMAAQGTAHDLSSLRKCVSAGEALPASTRALWQDATGLILIDGIGATEMLHIFISHDEASARPGATGRVVQGYEACVLDEQGQVLPPGQVGRLAVRGPTGCRYLDDARQTQYVQHGWNLTGDAYLMTEDGYFIYQARTDDMIISGGYNIAGPEVEAALLQHPAVAECGVVGVPDEARGMVVKAYVVLRAGHVPGAAMVETLQTHVKAVIAPYKYPRQVDFLSALPRTESGKLQRFRLREMALEAQA